MVVTPYVYEWKELRGCVNHEVEQFVGTSRLPCGKRELSRIPANAPGYQLPCCRYEGHCIWGLSYSMLQELLGSDLANQL